MDRSAARVGERPPDLAGPPALAGPSGAARS